MSNAINKLMNAARKYSAFDFGVFKITLIGIGILLGTYFVEFFYQYLNIVWIISIIGVIYMLFITLTKIKK